MVVFALNVRLLLEHRNGANSWHLSSGPKRYDYSPAEDDWFYSRDGQSLGSLLNNELSTIIGQDVDLGLREASKHI